MNLAVVTNYDSRTDVNISPDDAVLPNNNILANLGIVPDLCAFWNYGTRMDFSSWMYVSHKAQGYGTKGLITTKFRGLL